MSTARMYSCELPMRATSRRQPRVLADSASSHCARKAQISKPGSISGAIKDAKDAAPLAQNPPLLTCSRMPATTRRAVRDATNLLTATPDEAALIVACALTDPEDLLRLARARAGAGASRSSASPHRRRTALQPAAAAPQQRHRRT